MTHLKLQKLQKKGDYPPAHRLSVNFNFDDVTRINFRFRLLVTWSSPRGRDTSSHKTWCRYLYPVRRYWYFPKFKMAPAAILDFQIMWIWPFGCVDSMVCALYQIGLKYLHWSLRSTHLCFRRSFDDVTRINFRFRLLVTWSSAHGSDASFHKIWCRYIYPMRSYWHFAEIKDGGHRHLGFVGGAIGPPTKAHSWCVLPVKIWSWSDQ